MPTPSIPPILVIVLSVWSLLIKGVALWRAAHSDQKNWFVAILILNTVGILELFYLFKFAKKTLSFKEIKSWLPQR